MKQQQTLFLVLLCTILGTSALAQGTFTSCSAAFVDSKMVVDTYSPTGKCLLATTATGDLTVQTVELSAADSKAIDKIDFKVAIRDKATGTLHLFSNETYRQLPVQRVLASCKKGDHIVLLTLDNRYALPHNEIQVR